MAAAIARGSFGQGFAASAAREWRFLRSSPWDLAMATWVPCLCLATFAWLLGSAVPRALSIAVVDEDHSAMSRALVRALGAAPALRIVAEPPALTDAWALARALKVYAVAYIPPDASREIARGGAATVFVYYNASHRTAGQAAAGDIGSVVQGFSGQIARMEIARSRGSRAVGASPVLTQSTFLFNPGRSYEYFLLALLFPAVLHLGLTLSVVASLGRELRDGTAGDWLTESGDALLPAVAGKVLPYFAFFLIQSLAGLLWVAEVAGDGIHGSVALLVGAQGLMYLAYAAIGMLLVGATRNMATALSLTSLYAGTSLAFSGTTFPVMESSLFVRVWNLVLPFTSYVKLQVQQLGMGSPPGVSLIPLAALIAFVAIPGALGLHLYGRAARDPAAWGRR